MLAHPRSVRENTPYPLAPNLTCIQLPEVRFKNNGLDLIEIQDNGSGISPENYENVGTFSLPCELIAGLISFASFETLHVEVIDI